MGKKEREEKEEKKRERERKVRLGSTIVCYIDSSLIQHTLIIEHPLSGAWHILDEVLRKQ